MGGHGVTGAEDVEFVAYAKSVAPHLVRLGFLICGDWQRSEDAVQDTLLKLYRAWHRIDSFEALDRYTRQILARQLIDESRRPWRRERVSWKLPDSVVEARDPTLTHSVRVALAQLPKRQRTVLALRYYEELSLKETAEILAVSEGTVKSQAARGLEKLRRLLVDGPDTPDGGDRDADQRATFRSA